MELFYVFGLGKKSCNLTEWVYLKKKLNIHLSVLRMCFQSEGHTKHGAHMSLDIAITKQCEPDIAFYLFSSGISISDHSVSILPRLFSSKSVKKGSTLLKKGTGIFGRWFHDCDPCVLLQFKQEPIVTDYDESASWLCLHSPISHLISLCLTLGWEQ